MGDLRRQGRGRHRAARQAAELVYSDPVADRATLPAAASAQPAADAAPYITGPDEPESVCPPVIAAIPEGRVTTYGILAKYLRTGPRQVATILANFTKAEAEAYPWYRVVAAQGVVSSTKRPGVGPRQIKKLRAEGIEVKNGKVVDFKLLVWMPGLN